MLALRESASAAFPDVRQAAKVVEHPDGMQGEELEEGPLRMGFRAVVKGLGCGGAYVLGFRF